MSSKIITTVKEPKKTSRTMEKLRHYNENVRYQYKPTGVFTKHLPMWLSPIIAGIATSLLLLVFLFIFVIFDSSLKQFSGEMKGESTAIIWGVLAYITVICSFIVNWLLVYPFAKVNNFKTSKSTYLPNTSILAVILSVVIWFVFKEFNNNIHNISHIIFPFWFFTLYMINVFAFRGFNELYRRDKDGNIIMADEYIKQQELKKLKSRANISDKSDTNDSNMKNKTNNTK